MCTYREPPGSMMLFGMMGAAARVERTWSVGGRTIDDMAGKMKHELLSMIIFIVRNWKLMIIEGERTYKSCDMKEDTVKVKEVDVEGIRDLYIALYGKDKNRFLMRSFVVLDQAKIALHKTH